MENAELIISLIGTAFSLLITCFIVIAKLIGSVKRRKSMQESADLLDAIAPLMEIAEKHRNYSGEEKKEFVLTKLNQFSIENGIEFKAEEITERLEKLINLTKQVNTKKN